MPFEVVFFDSLGLRLASIHPELDQCWFLPELFLVIFVCLVILIFVFRLLVLESSALHRLVLVEDPL